METPFEIVKTIGGNYEVIAKGDKLANDILREAWEMPFPPMFETRIQAGVFRRKCESIYYARINRALIERQYEGCKYYTDK
jgi:hypothetical protein